MNEILVYILWKLGILNKIGDSKYGDFFKSNLGREYGWWIEYEGQIIGELINVEWEDMFWDSYELYSHSLDEQLFDRKTWYEGRFMFRSKRFERYAPHAFLGGFEEEKLEDGQRVLMRGLYLNKP